MTLRALLPLLCFCLAWPGLAVADEPLQFLYNRSSLVLVRGKAPALPPALPWLPQPAGKPAITFDVEVRDATTMYNRKGWFNLSSPSENQGVLMAFNAPGVAPLIRSTEFAPLDILMIDSEGRVTQIIPNLKLSELEHEIMPDHPILAFLFLKGGVAQHLSIRPGDTVEYPLFKKSPVVISTSGDRKVNAPPVQELEPQVLAPSAYKPTLKEPADSPIK